MNTSEINQLTQKICEDLDLTGITIPDEIQISTMTMDAKFPNINFYAQNIHDYIQTSENGIISISPAKRKAKAKKETTSIARKRKNKIVTKKEKSNVQFLNQVTVRVRVSQKAPDKPVSVKIFSNGTFHYTGVISIPCLLEATHKIIEECKKTRYQLCQIRDVDGNIRREIKEIKFVDDPEQLKLENMIDFSVNMINCNFKVPFEIDRPKLLVHLQSDDYVVDYDSNNHSAVNIKYEITNKESVSQVSKFREVDDLGKNAERVTVFVFESGSIIIIIGNQGFRPINEVYTFIYKYLLVNYDSIVKDDELTDSSIREYLEESEFKDKIKVERNNPNSTAYKTKGKMKEKAEKERKRLDRQKKKLEKKVTVVRVTKKRVRVKKKKEQKKYKVKKKGSDSCGSKSSSSNLTINM